MTTETNLNAIADASPYVFTGSIARMGASTMPALAADASTAVVAVEDVIKSPLGLKSFAGREITVQLLEPLAAGRYVFFADPWAVGGGIAVRERMHLDARAKTVNEQVADAIEGGYAARMAPRIGLGVLAALGTIGKVELDPNIESDQGEKTVRWAFAPFAIERVLKGDAELKTVTLVGPYAASKGFPRAPALRGGLHAILLLQPPPAGAPSPPNREPAFFIADTSDIQPPERVRTIEQIVSRAK